MVASDSNEKCRRVMNGWASSTCSSTCARAGCARAGRCAQLGLAQRLHAYSSSPRAAAREHDLGETNCGHAEHVQQRKVVDRARLDDRADNGSRAGGSRRGRGCVDRRGWPRRRLAGWLAGWAAAAAGWLRLLGACRCWPAGCPLRQSTSIVSTSIRMLSFSSRVLSVGSASSCRPGRIGPSTSKTARAPPRQGASRARRVRGRAGKEARDPAQYTSTQNFRPAETRARTPRRALP